eukprot:g5134.t1
MHGARIHPRRIQFHSVSKRVRQFHRSRIQSSTHRHDAYQELIHLAVEADPSLSTLASHHLNPPPSSPTTNKAPWLRQRGAQGTKYHQLTDQLRGLKLSTVCQEAQCPNIGECWSGATGTATIMILGDTCTRGCQFCAVKTSRIPVGPDPNEPIHTADAIASWNVGYIVITSVDRDDLFDGGASHFCQTVVEIKKRKPELLVECLSPDFSGELQFVAQLASCGLDVFAHNLETVERLQKRVRDPRANYFQSLSVLEEAKKHGVVTKSSLMLGLGEKDDEIIDAMLDLKSIGVEILTLGQYLQPTDRHLPVHRFVTPEEFVKWKEFGEETVGFT